MHHDLCKLGHPVEYIFRSSRLLRNGVRQYAESGSCFRIPVCDCNRR